MNSAQRVESQIWTVISSIPWEKFVLNTISIYIINEYWFKIYNLELKENIEEEIHTSIFQLNIIFNII